MTDFRAIHLLAPTDKVEATPHLTDDLARSVLVQCGEQEIDAIPGYKIGVLIYLRQDGRLVPGKVNPLLYILTIQRLVEALSVQALDVTIDRDLPMDEHPHRRKGDR